MATTTNPSNSCATSSTGSYGIPPPDRADIARRHLSDAGRQRLTSFPSRQRRMGPAPLASFEDLSMDKTTSDSSPEERNNLPDIGEETSASTTPVTPVAKTELSVPASPRIRVSAASSSSPHETDSKESTPEKDVISGYAKAAYCEDMAADLHSSTEELDADEEEKNRKRRERACKLAEIERREEALRISELNRKGSSSSVISDGLLPVTSGHSSRLSSLGSIGSARRSPSPHRMLLETSFCGSRPIQQPSIDLEDPPVTTNKLMNFTIEKIERVKSPMEAKPPDIFRSSPSTLPKQRQDVLSAIEVSTIEAEVLPVKTKASADAADRRGKPAEVKDLPITTATSPSFTEQQSTHLPRSPRHDDDHQQQHRQPLSSQSSPRSPRMPKKVPVPQVPDLKDLPKPSPSPTASSIPASSITPDHHGARTTSVTPSASPRASRRRRTRDEVESTSSSPSVSRKSSFTNLFRKSDNAMSPITPDSPGSSGRKSPFSQFIKSAKKEFRSRSRSRSRSKSRERDLDDDTHDRRSVLSIFKPKTKKQKDSEKGKGTEKVSASSDSKANEAITNVEFTFNDDGKYQSSTFGLIRQESELNRAIKEPLRGTVTPGSESEPQQQPHTEPMIHSRDSSYNELSSIMNSAEGKVVKEKIKEEESKEITDNEKRQTLEDDVFDKPTTSPVPPSVQPETKAKEADVNKVDKPQLPPKQKDRTSDADAISELSVQDVNTEADSRSESERDSEIDYLKTKEKVQQKGPGAPLESPEIENKVLVSQDSNEEGELPYVPTSLPFERPLAAPMVPVKERAPEMRHTQSIDRPRSTTPITPGRLEEYKQVASTPDADSDKMMISIPQAGPVKVLPSKSPKRQTSKSWEDFCQEGLRSPRQLRKEYKQSSLKSQDDDDKPPPLPPKARSPARSPVAQPSEDTTGQETVKSWINFDELPDVVLKPVRQIKTVPPRHQPRSQEHRKPHIEQQEQRIQKEIVHLHEVPPPRKHPPPLAATINHEAAHDSDGGQGLSEISTPDKADSFDHSSDSDKPTSPSSSEDLTTVRERLEEIKNDGDDYENSDLERLLAPVNDCINRLSSISSEPGLMERKSPIPDNWADFLLPPQPGRRSRLSSLGSETGSITGRSPSPSCMLLETSFCGSAPIDDPAAAEPDVPIAVARKLSGISLGDFSTFTTRDPLQSPNHLPCPDRTSILSDSSAEGGSPREADYYSRHHQESQRGQQGSHQQLNPFGMDLGVRSNRSSVVSQDQNSG